MIENKEMSRDEKERATLEFWKNKNIYEKSVKNNFKGDKFYMMDGPPYATGHIHMGTALNKISKDIVMRSHRMQGHNVFDRPGYDTHGVPIEFQIEKEIGSKSKQDIEKYGVKKFIDKCKEFATKYIDFMNSEFENLGVWMNFKEPYLTLSDEYIETIWDTFKEADRKNLLYLGKYPIHICPRCETAVAYNEIEYSKQEDTSIFVKFKLNEKENTYLIIFTTTPWTLPANTGIMVHPDFIYQKIEMSNGEKWIIAKELVPKIMAQLEMGYTVKEEFKGKEMKDWKYTSPLSKNIDLKVKNAYKVVLSGRYVTVEEGTGLVHCAPGHGKEDYEVGKENNLDMPSPVDINGNLTKEAGKYSGKRARVVDSEIIEDLEKENALVYKVAYNHDYPLCWRCKTPLLMISQPQWFLKISEIQKKILKDNEETTWIPSWMKTRMKAWLEGVSDWPISRKRYWGTPLPIWICDKCNKKLVIGSIDELRKLSKVKKIELHKPEIDKIEIKCECGNNMKRVSEVLDVWFDSGVSSWAALGYLKDKKKFNKFWPADLNLEGKDQIRGWWNSEFILSEIKFGKKPFDSISVHGMVLDLGKKKMSKSLGNIIAPSEIIEKYGRDFLRYYFARISKGEDFSFDEKEFSEIQNIFRVLVNVNTFINQVETGKTNIHEEDKWILSRFDFTVNEITKCYNEYKLPEAIELFEKFLVNDLSKTYIKMIRDRSDEVYEGLNEIRIGLSKLISPVIPFETEKIWQELRDKKIVKEESVHLSEFPTLKKISRINPKLEEKFAVALKIIELGLFERDKVQVGLKWPLAKATVNTELKIDKDLEEIIKNQLNVKNLEIKKSKELTIVLDTKITPELEAEGYAREISRKIQAARKNAGLFKIDKIKLGLEIDEDFRKIIENQVEFIKQRTNSKEINISRIIGDKDYKNKTEEKIKDKNLVIYFSKI
jgi:isoleucyl-tRNA synthetase